MSDITPAQSTALAPAQIDMGAAIQAAAELGKDGVEVLERLHAIQKDERAAASACDFHASLAQAKTRFGRLLKTKKGVHQKVYTPFPQIMATVEPPLAEAGIYISFDREMMGDREMMVCILTKGTHSTRSRYPIQEDPGGGKAKIHATASGNSYAMRYSVLQALGLSTVDPDDDGCAAAGPVVSDEQALELEALATDMGADIPALFAWGDECDSFATFPAAKFDGAMGILRKKAPR